MRALFTRESIWILFRLAKSNGRFKHVLSGDTRSGAAYSINRAKDCVMEVWSISVHLCPSRQRKSSASPPCTTAKFSFCRELLRTLVCNFYRGKKCVREGYVQSRAIAWLFLLSADWLNLFLFDVASTYHVTLRLLFFFKWYPVLIISAIWLHTLFSTIEENYGLRSLVNWPQFCGVQ